MTRAPDGKKPKRARGPSASRREQKRARPARPGDVKRLTAKLGVVPRQTELYLRALTHKSAEQELGYHSNERLEFLGDAVLGLVLAEHLHRRHPDLAEGELTKLKAVAVSEPILAAVGRELEVGRYLLLAKGEELTGGRDRSSILADTVEAIFAATYLDRGYRVARELILRLLADHLAAIERREYEPDYKTLLQEKIQEIHRAPPTYRVISQTGPDHDRTFVAEARIGRRVLGTGTGKSKKQAEQAAARQAMESEE